MTKRIMTPQEYLKELRILLFQRALYNYHAVMYLKKEIIISIFIITISASNLYMPMIWLYVFLLDFLIPFLCDPGLQCALTITKGHRNGYNRLQTVKIGTDRGAQESVQL
jgi:hypothetical protein